MSQQICQHHSLALVYFCETCQDLVCESCIQYGPHQTKNHDITSLEKAYQSRVDFLKNRIEKGLGDKKKQLEEHVKDIDERIHQIDYNRETIEKDIRIEFEGGIIKRLDDQKGHKLAVLQKDIVKLQQNINEIDDFIYTFEYLALTEENVLPLLFMSKNLHKELMRLLSIIIPTAIDVTPFDLPRELFNLRQTLQNKLVTEQQIEFKKQILWRLREQNNDILSKFKIQFFENMEIEIAAWVKLLKQIVNSFDQLCLICTFCGCFLSQDIVNQICLLNHREYDDEEVEFKLFTVEQPKQTAYGNNQHFFGNPKDEYLVFKKDQYPHFGDYYEQKKAAKEIYLKIFRRFIIVDLKARKYLKELDIREIFKKYDPDNDGFMPVIKFKYVLHHELGMSVEEVERIVNYFKEDKDGRNIVNYSYFLDVDWYIEELRRLEEEMKKDSGKYKKLYTHKNMSPKKRIQPIGPASSSIRGISQDDNNGMRKIYNVNLRFSQQPLQQQEQQETIKEDRQNRKHVQFNDQKVSVQESTLSQQRFNQSYKGENYNYKYYDK